jgi:hypothetical protein
MTYDYLCLYSFLPEWKINSLDIQFGFQLHNIREASWSAINTLNFEQFVSKTIQFKIHLLRYYRHIVRAIFLHFVVCSTKALRNRQTNNVCES